MVNRDKKFIINEGRAITNGKFAYGGFPRILNEEGGATEAYRDDNLGDVATRPYEALRKEFSDLHAAYKTIETQFNRLQPFGPEQEALKPAFLEARKKMDTALKAMDAHPEHVPEDPRKAAADTDFHKMNTDDIVAASFNNALTARSPHGIGPVDASSPAGVPRIPSVDIFGRPAGSGRKSRL